MIVTSSVRKITLSLALFAAAGLPAAAQTTPLPITNPSFEDASSGYTFGFANVYTPNSTQFPGGFSDGGAAGFVGVDTRAASLDQLTSVTLTAGSTYTFTADVGQRADNTPGSGDIALYAQMPDGTTTLLSVTPAAPAAGTFQPYTTVFVDTNPALNGQGLRLQVDKTSGIQISVDNLRGSITAAPEPSQFAAFGVGLLGLGALALRARKRQAA